MALFCIQFTLTFGAIVGFGRGNFGSWSSTARQEMTRAEMMKRVRNCFMLSGVWWTDARLRCGVSWNIHWWCGNHHWLTSNINQPNKCQCVRPSSDTSYIVIGSLELKVSKNHYLILNLGQERGKLSFWLRMEKKSAWILSMYRLNSFWL